MTAENPGHIGEERKFTIFERFLLHNSYTGNNLVVVHVFEYDSGIPTEAELRERVAGLQDRYPTLHARIEGDKSPNASFLVQEPWDPSRIVFTERVSPKATLESVNADHLKRFQRRSVSEPLWDVGLLLRDGSNDSGFVVVTCNHILMDGIGSLACALAVTNPQKLASLQPEQVITKTYDDTELRKPGLSTMLPSMWREMIVPALPKWLQSYATSGDPWPGQCPSPANREIELGLARIDGPTAKRLKDVAKTKGVSTLHPVLQTAYEAAVWTVFHNADFVTGEPKAGNASTPLHFVADTPRAERDTKLGHSAMTGVYTSLVEHGHDVRGTDDMWGDARKLAAFLKDPAADKAARELFSLLEWFPSGVDKKGNTGWMAYLNDRAAGAAPFFQSLQVSNLGRVELPPNAKDYAWSQIAHPSNMALAGSVAGHDSGCVLTTQWWRGLPPNDKMDEVHRLWEGYLTLMAEGTEGTIEEFAEEVRGGAKHMANGNGAHKVNGKY